MLTLEQLQMKVPIPERNAINSGLNPPTVGEMVNLFGEPSPYKRTEGVPIDRMNRPLRDYMTTRNVGPFAMTGFVWFLWDWKRIFDEVRIIKPELIHFIRPFGCLNVRLQRGSTYKWSNHAFGMAADFGFNRTADERDGEFVERGMLELYRTGIPHKYDMFWAAEYKIEDSMHWDASTKLIQRYAHLMATKARFPF